jgi:peptide/nickel transport system permease protein
MNVIASPAAPGAAAPRPARRLRDRAWRLPTLVIGTSIVALFLVVAAFAPLIATTGANATDPYHVLQGSSSQHLLGTDLIGHDIFSRIVFATRTDLKVGFLAVVTPFLTGTLLGLVTGYYGGWLDSIVMRIVEVVVAFPFYILVVALDFALGAGTRGVYIAVAAVGWVAYCRVIRAETLVVRRREYVLAARAAGLGDARVILRHVLPNVISQAIVYVMSDIVLVLLLVVTLGFFGLGVQPPTPDWGVMISDAQISLSTHWGPAIYPGLALALLALGLSLVGDGLADLLRPE